jgi:formylglycine-generating enzyme required for sulfatase activity
MTLVLLALSISLSAAETTKPGHKTIENSLGMKLVLIPAGEFMMGSEAAPEALEKLFPKLEKDRHGESRFKLPDEAPVHTVRITKPFYMGQHELTVGQFRKFVEAANYAPESIADGTGGYGFLPNKPEGGDAFDGRDPKYSWQNPGFKQGDDHPVVNVTWNDAQALCEWLNKTEGKKYRLPTEAEWEYCCRAGTRTHFHSGDEPKSLLKFANTYDLETVKNFPQWKEFALQASDSFAFTSPVGSFAPNGFGLYDMHGNVWEWCSDWYGEDYYSKSPVDDPAGPESGKVKVRRGGSWHTWPFYCRSSFRNWNTARTRYVLVGIRLVREAD